VYVNVLCAVNFKKAVLFCVDLISSLPYSEDNFKIYFKTAVQDLTFGLIEHWYPCSKTSGSRIYKVYDYELVSVYFVSRRWCHLHIFHCCIGCPPRFVATYIRYTEVKTQDGRCTHFRIGLTHVRTTEC
jgi:hypothetical protein